MSSVDRDIAVQESAGSASICKYTQKCRTLRSYRGVREQICRVLCSYRGVTEQICRTLGSYRGVREQNAANSSHLK